LQPGRLSQYLAGLSQQNKGDTVNEIFAPAGLVVMSAVQAYMLDCLRTAACEVLEYKDEPALSYLRWADHWLWQAENTGLDLKKARAEATARFDQYQFDRAQQREHDLCN
jgi:hypothetical protein